jgi:hypothetical protein
MFVSVGCWCVAAACAGPSAPAPGLHRVRLGQDDLAPLANAFAAANPGHALHWRPATTALPAVATARIALVQAGVASARIATAAGERSDALGVGDLLVLAPGETFAADAPVDLLVFELPAVPSASVPRIVRPDHDPRLTDTPGGCATDGPIYRRVALTWLDRNGPYTFHGLNAHRVRIDDSFTHYHPPVGGFDEFYLVQAVRPGAVLLTSAQVERIVQPTTVARAEVPGLLQATPLQPGDLLWLPRGLVHRGFGGVLAWVVTVPGFVPGAEIGVDHHLHAINERLGLTGADALPLHAAAADRPLVR